MKNITDTEQATLNAHRYLDKRHEITREWCGHPQSMYVVRFNGNYVGCRYTFDSALSLAERHNMKRIGIL